MSAETWNPNSSRAFVRDEFESSVIELRLNGDNSRDDSDRSTADGHMGSRAILSVVTPRMATGLIAGIIIELQGYAPPGDLCRVHRSTRARQKYSAAGKQANPTVTYRKS